MYHIKTNTIYGKGVTWVGSILLQIDCGNLEVNVGHLYNFAARSIMHPSQNFSAAGGEAEAQEQ
jgi:hypothetical protein